MILQAELLLITLMSALIAAYAQFIFKTNAVKFDLKIGNVISLLRRRGIVIGLALYVVSLAVYLLALRMGELSFVYPTFSSTFIFVMLISKFRLREQITARRAAGVAIIALGIFLVVIS